jgi:nucleoside-diphosphate-sugar epimerase
VTGGAGFIGSHLVATLGAAGCRVTVLDSLFSGYRENIAAYQDRLTFAEGDIRDEEALSRASADCEVVFHLAAMVSVPRTIENPVESAAVNDIGTLNVMEAARQNEVKRVVLSSSCAVYGNLAGLPNREDMATRPMSPYAVHKVCGENYASIYSELYGLEAVSLRYFNVYGPRQDPSSPYSGVISIFLERAGRGETPVIYGDGEQSRDFIFVADVVQANLLAARQSGITGQVFNIGTGRDTTVNRLWKAIRGLANATRAPEYQPAREGDIRTSVADIRLAEETLGFQAQTPFEEGLALTYDWYGKKA